MIYSVHSYFSKLNSNKAGSKFEGIVFAKDRSHAEELVRGLISKYPTKIENISVIGNSEKTLADIYTERPELIGVLPEKGYIYDEYSHSMRIRKYIGL